jgi:hypothetical protein
VSRVVGHWCFQFLVVLLGAVLIILSAVSQPASVVALCFYVLIMALFICGLIAMIESSFLFWHTIKTFEFIYLFLLSVSYVACNALQAGAEYESFGVGMHRFWYNCWVYSANTTALICFIPVIGLDMFPRILRPIKITVCSH